ncbi:uncharacterized protein LOC116482213 isoform X2 [Hylobates moloch]|uniref:uncharacterized protein LOC116482213 isoform X2 n=1 Tax=Hylobates moloch TaxID=81572 RepID=UPI00136486CC|nr:uncharacterized protein LOC116482213 isoform X2 [Hylobates moloch]
MPSGRGNSTDAERGSGVRRKKMRGRLYGNSFLFTKVSQVKQWEWRRNKEICKVVSSSLLLPITHPHVPPCGLLLNRERREELEKWKHFVLAY